MTSSLSPSASPAAARVARVSVFPAVNRLNTVRVLFNQLCDIASLLSGPPHPFATAEVTR